MYRRPRKRPYIGWLAAILAAALFAGAIYGLVMLFSGTQDLDNKEIQLPTSDPGGIFPWADGVLCVESNQLYCKDLKGTQLWQTALPAAGMKASRVLNLTVAWGSKTVLIIDENGSIKQNKTTTYDVVLAAPGIDDYAVVTKEEGQYHLRLYSVKTNAQVDEEPFPDESVLGMGFFGDNLGQLWTLALDSHGTTPVTKLTTYYPGKSTSGEITLDDEIGYSAILNNKLTYIVGTHTLSFWEHNSSQHAPSKLIYGWNLLDSLVEDNGSISFLLAPSESSASGQISALWYINVSGEEYRIPLPTGCFTAMLKDHGKICVATHNGIWSMNDSGTDSRFYPISSTVDSIPAVVPGKAFVIQVQHRNYLLNMP